MDAVVLSKKRGDLTKWKKKSTAIAHSVISAVRPASFLIALYGGNHLTTTLDKLRYKQYVISAYKASANMASIPPTLGAAQQHGFRVFHQVQQWIGNYLDPEQWGWKLIKNKLVPITTLKPPAPERLLQLISCKCKTDCRGRCGCRQAGLFCTKLCQQCEGSCSNIDKSLDIEEEEYVDEPHVIPLFESADVREGINSCNILKHYATLLLIFLYHNINHSINIFLVDEQFSLDEEFTIQPGPSTAADLLPGTAVAQDSSSRRPKHSSAKETSPGSPISKQRKLK